MTMAKPYGQVKMLSGAIECKVTLDLAEAIVTML